MSEQADTPTGGPNLLAVDGVSKRFQSGPRSTQALHRVSLHLRRGTLTGLIGPDGAGKTTLMRLIAGLLLPDEGQLSVLGIDVIQNPLRVQREIGYMPQRFGLYEDLTVRENLDLYADLRGLSPGERPARYEALITMTGLGPFPNRLAGKLSGGMKQKLGLACTLLQPPRLLLLDEPTVGVDPVSRRELWTIVHRLVESEATTVLLSTAYLDEAERCDDVILLHRGEVLGQGHPQDFSRPLAGRSFQVSLPEINRRALQGVLTRAPGVIDATLQRGGVRLVMSEGTDATPATLLPGYPSARVTPVPPRFEDGFISLLKKKEKQLPAGLSGRSPRLTIASNPTAGRHGVARGRTPCGPTEDATQVRRDNPSPPLVSPIVVDRVTKRFGRFVAVNEVSFSVKEGEVFGLLGANGAGKSTTFRMLCGLLPASAGTLRVAGKDLRRAPAEARAHIGYMAQRFSLYGDLSVTENLSFFSRAYGLSGTTQSDRVAWALEEFELGPFADMTSGQLPLGYKQRLALAAALMHRPRILFLDEPTSGVDPLARREFWARIARLADEGVTILVTTHFMEEAEYCDRVVIMAEGAILAEGTPDALCQRVQSATLQNPTMEDAFIRLIERHTDGGPPS